MTMKCPYCCDRHTIQQVAYDYEEEGRVSVQNLIEHNTTELMDCLREECGAWKDGHCGYVGAVN